MADAIIYNAIYVNHAPIRPLGAHQIANWLRKWGYTVKVIDFCNYISTDDLYKITCQNLDKNTKFIGVNSTFWSEILYVTTNFDIHEKPKTIEPDWIVQIRERFLDKKIDWVLGGVYASFPARLFKFNWTCFPGFAEDEILRYMDSLTNKIRVTNKFDIVTQESRFSLDCAISSTEVLPIELSRGCQFKCTFCRYPNLGKKKGTYIRNIKCVKEEFEYNYYNFGTTKYFFMDDTVNESDEKINELANMVSRLPFKIQWVGYNRLDLIGSRPHSIETLKGSGLVSSYFGIESFHPVASQIVGKGWNGKQGKDFLLKVKDQWGDRVAIEVGLIAGLNGESEQDLYDTQQWCFDNNIHSWRWTALSISRHPEQLWKSEFDTEYEKYGYRFSPGENYNWTSDYWTRQKAVEITDKLNEERRSFVRLNPWHAAFVASLGYSFDELFAKKNHELDYDILSDRTKIFLKNYIKAQLN